MCVYRSDKHNWVQPHILMYKHTNTYPIPNINLCTAYAKSMVSIHDVQESRGHEGDTSKELIG